MYDHILIQDSPGHFVTWPVFRTNHSFAITSRDPTYYNLYPKQRDSLPLLLHLDQNIATDPSKAISTIIFKSDLEKKDSILIANLNRYAPISEHPDSFGIYEPATSLIMETTITREGDDRPKLNKGTNYKWTENIVGQHLIQDNHRMVYTIEHPEYDLAITRGSGQDLFNCVKNRINSHGQIAYRNPQLFTPKFISNLYLVIHAAFPVTTKGDTDRGKFMAEMNPTLIRRENRSSKTH